MALVQFIRTSESNIGSISSNKTATEGALYVATDTGTMWLGTSGGNVLQIKDNINTNTTYRLTKSGNNITLTGSDGSTTTVTDANTTYTLSSFGINATATQINYLSGVTSNIQTQLNSKAASTHTHSGYAASDIIAVQSTQPTSSTCLLWIKP